MKKKSEIYDNKKIIGHSFIDSLKYFSPKKQIGNPVMFVVYLGAIITMVIFILSFFGGTFKELESTRWYVFTCSIVLWLTSLFGNFAEAIAEGRGKAQADSLKKTRKDIIAHKIETIDKDAPTSDCKSVDLKLNDLVIVKANEQIPMDGEVVAGVASVDESAITGESAPVIRESGGDRSSVTGGTTVTSDWIIIKITSTAGNSFIDKMIAMVEGASRKKTPNEIALQILLVTLTIIFLVVCACLLPFSYFFTTQSGTADAAKVVSITNIIALLVCLAPTTIGALLSSIGIAGMARLNKANVLATSGRAVEAAGDVDTLLLDKTGTITLGNRQASEFLPVKGITLKDLALASQLASLADETAEGRSITVLAKNQFGFRGKEIDIKKAKFIEFSALTRMSGIDYEDYSIRKGASEAIKEYVISNGHKFPKEADEIVAKIASLGGTPLVVERNFEVLGVIYLKDIVKSGIKEKFADLRKIGIKTIMVTGDNPMTAAAIASEAGVDDFISEARPETKMDLIKKLQFEGHIVAMTGDGTNDAPALSQADVAVAMNSGTQAAKEAGNMVDLDSNPAKLIEVVKIGKQLLMTRGSLTTFSICNDVAKYFAIIPILFSSTFPGLNAINFLHLHNVETAILASLIYNALIIVALIPLSLKGVKYREEPANKVLKKNLLIYGLGGILAPFLFIWLFDLILFYCGVGGWQNIGGGL